ncbi:MAG: hypothetical protein ACRER2_17850 [Methylococcales bacterium]
MSTQRLSGGTGIDRRAASLRFHPTQWFGWVFALTLGLWAILAQGEEFRYRYVSLNDKVPPGFAFFGFNAINNKGQVSGTVFNYDDVSCFDEHVVIYDHGVVRVLQPGIGIDINARGTIGGQVVLNSDPNNFMTQAALFLGIRLKLIIPPQPGGIGSSVWKLNDSATALARIARHYP